MFKLNKRNKCRSYNLYANSQYYSTWTQLQLWYWMGKLWVTCKWLPMILAMSPRAEKSKAEDGLPGSTGWTWIVATELAETAPGTVAAGDPPRPMTIAAAGLGTTVPGAATGPPTPNVATIASLSRRAGGLCLVKAFIRRWSPPSCPAPLPPGGTWVCFLRICSTGRTERRFFGSFDRAWTGKIEQRAFSVTVDS